MVSMSYRVLRGLLRDWVLLFLEWVFRQKTLLLHFWAGVRIVRSVFTMRLAGASKAWNIWLNHVAMWTDHHFVSHRPWGLRRGC